jgi:hypothetical protein
VGVRPSRGRETGGAPTPAPIVPASRSSSYDPRRSISFKPLARQPETGRRGHVDLAGARDHVEVTMGALDSTRRYSGVLVRRHREGFAAFLDALDVCADTAGADGLISLRAGIVLDCDLGRALELLDHGKAAVSLDDACCVGVLVPGEDEEASGVAADGFVLRARHLE